VGVGAVEVQLAIGAERLELLTGEGGETPLVGVNNLLATGELVLGPAKSLLDVRNGRVRAADGEQGLVNVDTGGETLGLAPSTTHTGLETVSASAGKHLVDTEDVEGVSADTEVESLLAAGLDNVLVARNAGSLESLRRDLLLLLGDQVNASGELLDAGLLGAEVIDADLRVGDTTAEAGLRVRLVTAVTVATGRTATHGETIDAGEGKGEFVDLDKNCPNKQVVFLSLNCFMLFVRFVSRKRKHLQLQVHHNPVR
jgi:hypothetical protein